MKRKMTLVLYLLLFSFSIAFGQKKTRYVLITGTVVDSMGYFMPHQKVALTNKKGNDKKIMFTDAYGIFSYKVKRKNLKRFAVCAYDQYSGPSKVSLNKLIYNNRIVLPTNRHYRNHDFIDFNTGNISLNPMSLEKLNRSIRCRVYVETSRYPMAFVASDYIRSHFPMVK